MRTLGTVFLFATLAFGISAQQQQPADAPAPAPNDVVRVSTRLLTNVSVNDKKGTPSFGDHFTGTSDIASTSSTDLKP
ncbi:MAG TPA: hypothetical protein VN643_04440 [Pyrinomonadaceae bacterium]|nr:hypothetical protein [Pyrinomonadaceae bacterium]